MNRISVSLTLIALCEALFARSAAAQHDVALSPQDYIDIRQLIDGYPQLLDNCTNGGYDYADLFSVDGTFGVSSEWGRGAKIWFRGRDGLAVAAGGGKDGCRPRPSSGYHLTINPTITPTAGGARATSTLLTITNDTNDRGDVVHWEGGYEDTFEKTADGWRFKSRVHVWPEVQWTDRPEDMPPRNLAEE